MPHEHLVGGALFVAISILGRLLILDPDNAGLLYLLGAGLVMLVAEVAWLII